MTTPVHDEDRIAQYIAGTLDANGVEEFERHLLTCAACRAHVRLGAATRAALRASARPDPLMLRPRRSWRPVAVTALAAATLITVIVSRQGQSGATLGDAQPAPFVSGIIRPSSDSADTLVDRGMMAYAASDFRAAAELLEDAFSSDSTDAVRFFLGVSLLMRREDERALRVLERVPLESPYGAEGAYYRAKAWVRLRRPDSAIAALERAGGQLPLPMSLRAFLDSLKRP